MSVYSQPHRQKEKLRKGDIMDKVLNRLNHTSNYTLNNAEEILSNAKEILSNAEEILYRLSFKYRSILLHIYSEKREIVIYKFLSI